MLKGVFDFVAAGRANVFSAYAIDTAPVIWSTAAGTGGPLLYNPPTSGVTAFLLAITAGNTTASGAAGDIGLTGGPTTAPTSTTTIDSVGNLRISTGAPAPKCLAYRVGTPSAAGTFFMPVLQAGTGALTVDNLDTTMTNLGGLIEVGIGNFVAVAAGSTLTSGVYQIGLIWAEVPND